MHEKKNTILIVDNDPHMQKMLSILLDIENFKIVESMSGKEAVRLCIATKPDLILLDLSLPDIDGKGVITAIREWSQVPIIILSARCSDEEITASLNMGANDYVVKPFNVDVLLARINASLRVSAVRETGEPELCNGNLRMDLVRHEVFLHNNLLPFTPKEYDLLRHFLVNRGKMLTHKEILDKVWGVAHSRDTTYLRVFVGQIREKIEVNPTLPIFITTMPGIGYRMEVLQPTVLQAA
jgi:two-component system, OmpR family, KDP operon response regulator KdpE